MTIIFNIFKVDSLVH